MPQNSNAIVEYDPEQAKRNGSKKKKPQQAPPEHPIVDDDDVSDVSGGIDERDPDNPRFKYSTAEMDDGSPRNQKCCIIIVVVLCIIVAIIVSIVMVTVTKDKDKENKATTLAPTMTPVGEDGKRPAKPGIDLFTETRAFVETRCSPSALAQDRRTCEGACQDFDCCDPSLPRDESCFFHNRQGCLNYSRCHVLNLLVDAPPDNLEQICSPQRIRQDRSECETQCNKLECCWKDDLSCVSQNFYACSDYRVCQNLRDGDLIVPIALDTVDDLCDATQTGSVTQTDACDNACAPASCCWSDGTTIENCLQSQLFTCLSYGACNQLDLTPAGEILEVPEEDSVKDGCSFGKLNTGNTGACENACKAGSCCVANGAANCFMDDPLTCLQYDRCKLLA